MLVELSPQLWGTRPEVPIGTSCSKEWFWYLPFTNLKLIYVFSSGILSTMVYSGFNVFFCLAKMKKNLHYTYIFSEWWWDGSQTCLSYVGFVKPLHSPVPQPLPRSFMESYLWWLMGYAKELNTSLENCSLDFRVGKIKCCIGD